MHYFSLESNGNECMKLKNSFYRRKTETVARQLLGKKLVHLHNGQRLSGIITETEAYLGLTDRACHTFGGRKTGRVKSMYLDGGHSYVYLIYGMYFCFNVVTRTAAHPEAVLIRALEPVEGISQMQELAGQQDIKKLTNGPGKLCRALNITKQQDGLSLLGKEIFIEDHLSIPKQKVISRSRIGIASAQEAVDWPLRFYIKDNEFISKK